LFCRLSLLVAPDHTETTAVRIHLENTDMLLCSDESDNSITLLTVKESERTDSEHLVYSSAWECVFHDAMPAISSSDGLFEGFLAEPPAAEL
jgi:hypothetical protein